MHRGIDSGTLSVMDAEMNVLEGPSGWLFCLTNNLIFLEMPLFQFMRFYTTKGWQQCGSRNENRRAP